MTKEEIIKKAYEVYPISAQNDDFAREQDYKREGYIKALTELSELPTVHGWVARDEDYSLYLYTEKPDWKYDHWWLGIPDNCQIELDESLYPEVGQGEIVEVNLIIQKI